MLIARAGGFNGVRTRYRPEGIDGYVQQDKRCVLRGRGCSHRLPTARVGAVIPAAAAGAGASSTSSDRTPRRGGQWLHHRQVINGGLRRTRTGSPSRDLPDEYGKRKTVYMRHRRWSADGAWARVHDELRRG